MFEAPRGRLPALLADIVDQLGDREVSVAREMTKKFETVITAPASALAAGLGGDMLRGECVVLIAPRADPARPDDKELDALLGAALEGLSLRDAVSEVTRSTGLSRAMLDRALCWIKAAKTQMTKAKKKQPGQSPRRQRATKGPQGWLCAGFAGQGRCLGLNLSRATALCGPCLAV